MSHLIVMIVSMLNDEILAECEATRSTLDRAAAVLALANDLLEELDARASALAEIRRRSAAMTSSMPHSSLRRF